MEYKCCDPHCIHYTSYVDKERCEQKMACQKHFPMSEFNMVAIMFLMREDLRKRDIKSIDNLLEFLKIYSVQFRDKRREMDFISELHHTRYYPVGEFENLCFKCIDFDTLKQLDIHEPSADEYRPITRKGRKQTKTPYRQWGIPTKEDKDIVHK